MIIYRIQDKKTGKGYIGKTERSFEQRVKEHLNLLTRNKHHNPYLQNIFNKDTERISFLIIEESISCLLELNEKEILHITEQGEFNIAKGGEGGDTLSKHPNKAEIFKERNRNYPQKRGKENPNYKHTSVEQENTILHSWKYLPVPSLKEVSLQTGYSTYVCKRVLENHEIDIPDRHETQKRLIKEGINTGSRNPNFTKAQIEYIRKRYEEDWIGCKKISKELGFKSESPILRVIKELGILRTKSEWTTYSNIKNHIKYAKHTNTQ